QKRCVAASSWSWASGPLFATGWRGGGNRPEVDRPSLHAQRLLRLPVAHVERVRDDARARLELLEQLRLQLLIERRKQIQRDDSGLADVGREEILVEEFDFVGDAGGTSTGVGLSHAVGIDIDTNPARTVYLRCGDRNAAITRAEVVDDVVL